MRGVTPTASSGRLLALCAVVLLAVSCRWGGQDAPGGERPPGAPTGVTAEAGSSTSVHVMWNRAAPAGSEVTGYEVYRGPTKVKDVPASTHMVDVTRLRPATTYVFTVRARDADGRLGPPSREVRATTPAAVRADTAPPTGPGDLEGRAAGSRAVQLSWTAARDDRGVVSYTIYHGDSPIHSVGGNQTAAVVTGLRPGTRYVFTVRARAAADNLSPPAPAVRLTTAEGADGGATATAPADFRATTRSSGGAYYIVLSWTPPRVDGTVAEYEVRLDGRPVTSLVYGGAAPRDRATYRFYAGEEAGVTHRVRISALLPDGTWGAFSAERTVTTGAGG